MAALLTPYKRPRDVRYVEALPRNDMGKVLKKRLGSNRVSGTNGGSPTD